jgi:hypothetical protein
MPPEEDTGYGRRGSSANQKLALAELVRTRTRQFYKRRTIKKVIKQQSKECEVMLP